MTSEEITLACPYCQAPITRPLSWFKQPYTTCPQCGGGLAAGQFAPLVAEIEQAFDTSIEEMIHGSGQAADGSCPSGCSHGPCSRADEP